MEIQSGFFDLQDRHKKLNERDSLQPLDELIDWEIFRKPIKDARRKARRSKAGRKPFDAVLMFKIIVLQALYNLSYDQTEYQVCEWLSFMRFSGLDLDEASPSQELLALS